MRLNIHLRRLTGMGKPSDRHDRPDGPFKAWQQRFGDKARARRIVWNASHLPRGAIPQTKKGLSAAGAAFHGGQAKPKQLRPGCLNEGMAMASLVEHATLLVRDRSTAKINQINAVLRELFATAK
jgi:hypothetical protein